MPAALTMMPSGPSARTASPTARSTSSQRLTSAAMNRASLPISSATALPPSGRRSTTATGAPAAASARAIARPMPEPPPVTIAVPATSVIERSSSPAHTVGGDRDGSPAASVNRDDTIPAAAEEVTMSDPQLVAFAVVAGVVHILPGAQQALLARNVLAARPRGRYLARLRLCNGLLVHPGAYGPGPPTPLLAS